MTGTTRGTVSGTWHGRGCARGTARLPLSMSTLKDRTLLMIRVKCIFCGSYGNLFQIPRLRTHTLTFMNFIYTFGLVFKSCGISSHHCTFSSWFIRVAVFLFIVGFTHLFWFIKAVVLLVINGFTHLIWSNFFYPLLHLFIRLGL